MDKMERELPSYEAPFPEGLDLIVEAMLGEEPIPASLVAMTRDPAWMAARAQGEQTLRDKDWPNLGRYEANNAALAMSGVRPGLIFMGDSISELWPLADLGLLKPGRICRAIGGQTTPQMLLRFQADVLAHQPRAVHLLAGSNDIAGITGPTTPYRYQCNMQAMVALARASGITVLLGLIPPCSAWLGRPELQPAPWIAELNEWLRVLAQDNDCILVDYHAALDDGSGGMLKDCSQDGLHPNRRGYARMRAVLKPLLDEHGL
jgi:lysophospholipase L1-like esterase